MSWPKLSADSWLPQIAYLLATTMKKDQGQETTIRASAARIGLKRPNADSARSQGIQASSCPSARQNAQEARCKVAKCKAKKKESGKSNWPRRSGRSGKSGWSRWNAKRRAASSSNPAKQRSSSSADTCQKPSGRYISKAVRAESPTFQSQGSQTDANFFLLSELPDSAYESVESELGEFLDDEIVDFRNNNSDDDGYWSPKAYSI